MQTYKHAHGFNDKFFVFTFQLFRRFLCTLRWRLVQVGQALNVHILPNTKNNDLHKGRYTLCFLIGTMRMIGPSTTILDSPKSHGVTTCDSLLTNHFFPHKTLSTTSQHRFKRGVFFTENPDVYKLTSHQTKCPFFPQFQHPNPNSNQLTMDWYWPSFNFRSSRFEGLLGLLGDLLWNTWMPDFSRRTGFQSQGGKR